jgi:hypothetical protein
MDWLGSLVSSFPSLRPDAEPVAIERGTGRCIGSRVPMGAGSARVLGFGWVHRLDTQWQAVREFLHGIGCRNPAAWSRMPVISARFNCSIPNRSLYLSFIFRKPQRTRRR